MMEKSAKLQPVQHATESGMASVSRSLSFYHSLVNLNNKLTDPDKEAKRRVASFIKRSKQAHDLLSGIMDELIKEQSSFSKTALDASVELQKIASVVTPLLRVKLNHIAQSLYKLAEEKQAPPETKVDGVELDLPQALLAVLKSTGVVVIDSSERKLNNLYMVGVQQEFRKEVWNTAYTLREMILIRNKHLNLYSGISRNKGTHAPCSFMVIAKNPGAVKSFLSTWEFNQLGRIAHLKDIMVKSRPYGVFVVVADVPKATLSKAK